MDNELKQLIEDAAKLLGYIYIADSYRPKTGLQLINWGWFNPLDPERGDLWKVADIAELVVDHDSGYLHHKGKAGKWDSIDFTKGDYQSQALAVLRAASAVWKSRGAE